MVATLHSNSEAAPVTVTVKECQARTGLSRATVFRLLGAGKLRARKLGTRTLVEWSSVIAHINSLPRAEFRAPSKKSA